MVEILLQLPWQAVSMSGACNTVALQYNIVHHMAPREVIVSSEMEWRSKICFFGTEYSLTALALSMISMLPS
jgi:hypothetical protein